MNRGRLMQLGDKKTKKVFKKKNIIIGIVIFVVFFASAAVISWYVMQNSNKKIEDKANPIVLSENDKKVISIRENYNKTKNVEDAAKAYDEVISQTSDVVKKSSTMVAKSVIYLNNKDYEQALAIAKQAVEVDTSFNSQQYLAQVYQAMKNYEDAIIAYQKAIELIDNNSPMAESDKAYIEQTIVDLNKLNTGSGE